MVRNQRLSKSILDAGWGYLRDRFVAKAANGRRQIVLVDPAYTSKTCSTCGQEFQNFDLSTRWVTCDACGLALAREVFDDVPFTTPPSTFSSGRQPVGSLPYSIT